MGMQEGRWIKEVRFVNSHEPCDKFDYTHRNPAGPLRFVISIVVFCPGEIEQCEHTRYGIPEGGISEVPPHTYPNSEHVISELVVNQGMPTFY